METTTPSYQRPITPTTPSPLTSKTEVKKEVKKEELTQAQKIRAKIKELQELETLEKKLAKNASERTRLLALKKELETKYGLAVEEKKS